MIQTAAHQPKANAQAPSRTKPTNVRIDIAHLSVEGYTAAQYTRFMRTLEAALRTLAAQPRDWSALAAPGEQHTARVAPLTPRPGTTPEQAARELAQRLFSRLASAAPVAPVAAVATAAVALIATDPTEPTLPAHLLPVSTATRATPAATANAHAPEPRHA